MPSPSSCLALAALLLAGCTSFSGAEVSAGAGAMSGGSGQGGSSTQAGAGGMAGGQAGGGAAGQPAGAPGAGQGPGGASEGCGDGVIEGDETCDGAALGEATCPSVVGPGSIGALSCTSQCRFDVSGCTAPPACGNGRLDPGEGCDGADLAGATCESVVGKSAVGQATCTAQCTLSTTGCHWCGDGSLDPGESCDDGSKNGSAASPCSASCEVTCGGPGFFFDATSGHCYWLGSEAVDWYKARLRCQQQGPGFDLASLATSPELTRVRLAFLLPTKAGSWLGGNDVGDVDKLQFHWLDGEPWAYPNGASPWKYQEPNNYLGRERCLSWESEGWNDQSCLLFKLPPLCERGPQNQPLCRDGKVEGDEACDDGNTTDQDGCSNTCQQATCGNGKVEGDEECDDGNAVNTDACTTGCRLAVCGDGFVQPGEDCETPQSSGCPGSCVKTCSAAGAFKLGHSCYALVTSASSWDTAKTSCSTLASGAAYALASLETADEVDLLNSHFASSASSLDVWIGGRRSSGSFQWLSGAPFSFAAGQSPWATGQPADGLDCLAVSHQPPGDDSWHSESCATALPSLCEW